MFHIFHDTKITSNIHHDRRHARTRLHRRPQKLSATTRHGACGGGTPQQLYTKLVEVYGAKRIMWSSNYPAHPKFGGVKSRLEASKKALAHLSADDQAWIFGKTALSFYPGLNG